MLNRIIIAGCLILFIMSVNACGIDNAAKTMTEEKPDHPKLPAIELAERNGIVPEKGTPMAKAKELIIDYLSKNGTKGDIQSHIKLREITTNEIWQNASVQLFRVDLEYAWLHGLAAIRNGKVLCILDGMPALSVFLADLDNDKCYEIYTNAYFGSGIVSLEIRGYNIASDERYSLSMRGKKDLKLFVEDKLLMVNEYDAADQLKEGSKPISTGKLSIKDGTKGKELFLKTD